MVRFELLEPKNLSEACSLLVEYKDKAKIIAGGHGLLPLLKHRAIIPKYLINIKGLPGLEYITNGNSGLKIGALTTHRAIELSALIKNYFPMLVELEQVLGCVQTRNWATIGGNLCDATPANDPPPALIALGAKAKAAGVGGEREISLDEFTVGYRQTALKADEILVEIQIPTPPAHTGGAYHKERVRIADSPIASVAAVVSLDDRLETVTAARIVMQAVGPTPIRAGKAEEIATGEKVQDKLIDEVAVAAAREARPISDVYGSAEYKKEMIKMITRQVVTKAIERARQ